MELVPKSQDTELQGRRRPAGGPGRGRLRGGTAATILGAALGLGVVTGRFILPPPPSAHSSPVASVTSARPTVPASSSATSAVPTSSSAASTVPTSSSATPDSGSSSESATPGHLTTLNLLAAADFKKVGVTQRLYARERVGDGYYNAACQGQKTFTDSLGLGSLEQPLIRGLMTTPDGNSSDPTIPAKNGVLISREFIDDAGTVAMAVNYFQRLVLEEAGCQSEPPGHWIYGPTITIDIAPGVTASWMGIYSGSLNTTGAAPADTEPCGGYAVLRNGSRYGVVDVETCLGTAAMTQVVTSAATLL